MGLSLLLHATVNLEQFVFLNALRTFPRRCCSTGGLQRDSAVCGNTQVLLSGGDPVRINTSPYQLFPSHYNWESYLLPNCPSSAGLRLESLIAALF